MQRGRQSSVCEGCSRPTADAPILVQNSAQKKTALSAQNIENKRSGFFLPRRSMVLKVVTGKILKAWKLWCCADVSGSVLAVRSCMVKLSNIGCSKTMILLQVIYMCLYYRKREGEVKKKAVGLWGP